MTSSTLPLRTTPSVPVQVGQRTEMEATKVPQKHHHTLINKLVALPDSHVSFRTLYFLYYSDENSSN